MDKKDFILASASPQRLALLEQINLAPKEICPADIDESFLPREAPSAYVKRMAEEKAAHVAALRPGENILAADTVVVVGRRILRKAQNDEEQTAVMNLLVERGGRKALRFSDSRVITRKLTPKEIENYVASGEWHGCSGYKIEGRFAGYVRKIVGSYSGIVGLPLFETQNLLNGAGIR